MNCWKNHSFSRTLWLTLHLAPQSSISMCSWAFLCQDVGIHQFSCLCQGHAPWPTSSLLDKALQHNSYHNFLFCGCTVTNTFASPSDGCISFGRFFRWGVKGPGSSLSTNISTEFIFIQHCFFPFVEWAGSMATKALLALHVNNWMRRIAHSCFGDL